LVEYKIKFVKQAFKDVENLKAAGLDSKAKKLLEIIKNNPFQTPPPYEKLIGDLKGLYSRRINIQHRIVYEVFQDKKTVKIIRMWKHYE
jgi:toxin-antitoxin system, toxin component, Txe/YoeB family